jgi:eukaryotic-like serine/threonine-protein kinase
MNEESLFAKARALASATERQAFLDEACAGDDRLRQRLGWLLAANERARGILDHDQDAATILGDYSPEPQLAARQVFDGRFQLRHKIGEGGMGEVWLADQTEPVRRRVALKMVRPRLASARLHSRFDQEKQALAIMDHPNIAKVLDAGVAGGRPFFVMEFIEGVPITRFCDEARLSPRERLELFLSVCAAVQHAHQKGIIHRDLKPSNILVARYDGKPAPKVIDFGVAKATGPRLTGQGVSTEVGTLVGTIEYMSPEQAEPNGLDVDTRSDVYALGVVLYELLTGTVPFCRQKLQAVPFAGMLRIIREVEPPRPSARLADASTLPAVAAARRTEPAKLRSAVRGELDWIVMKCLEKDRNRRYETASSLAADLRRYLADEPVLAGPPSTGYRLGKFLRRNRGPVLAAGLVLLALVGGIVGTTIGLVRAVQARRAESERAEGERLAKQTAEKRLAQIEKGIDLLASVFEDLDPLAEEKEGRPLRAILGERLDLAAAELQGDAVGDPLVVARLQDRLGRTCYGLGRHARAEELFTRAAATRQAHLGPEDPLTLASAYFLAHACREAGKTNEAVRRFEQVRDAQARTMGPEASATLSTLDGLAAAYCQTGESEKAVALLEQVRDTRLKHQGADDRRTLITLSNLVSAYLVAGRTKEAIDLARQVLEGLREKYGADDPRTLTALNNLANAYGAGYKMRESRALLEQARAAIVPKLAPDHPQTLILLDNLARTYYSLGRSRDAIALAEQVREKRVMTLGARHRATLVSLETVGLAYQGAGQLDKALPSFQQAAAGVEQLEFAHYKAGTIIGSLCDCLERLKQYGEAEAWRRKWLAVLKKKDGPDSPAFAQELLELGSNLLQQRKYAGAEPVLGEGLTLFQKHQPQGRRAFYARSLLGAALLGQQKYALAEPLLVQGYRGMEQADKETRNLCPAAAARMRQQLSGAAERLVRLYEAWGKPEEAASWRKELEAL